MFELIEMNQIVVINPNGVYRQIIWAVANYLSYF